MGTPIFLMRKQENLGKSSVSGAGKSGGIVQKVWDRDGVDVCDGYEDRMVLRAASGKISSCKDEGNASGR